MQKNRKIIAVKKGFKKFVNFLDEDSILSWVVNVVLAFLIIKFLVYPALGFVFNTGYPIVAVVSGSMEHDGSFDDWWSSEARFNDELVTQSEYYSKYDISKEKFKEFSFKNGFNTGDIMVLKGATAADLEVGDIIVFISYKKDPIIHRVIEKNIISGQVSFRTKGDHNIQSYDFESNITEDKIIGKAIFRLPFLGYIKIIFFKIIGFFIGG